MGKVYRCVQPEYVRRFRCDGRACGSDCCARGWRIAVEPGVYEAYAPARETILPHIRYDADTRRHELAFPADGRCPFLRADFLCDLQFCHGEAFLPDACAEYPRLTWAFSRMAERSLDLSCPVAAREALLPHGPMRFETVALRMGREGYAVSERRVERLTLLANGERQSIRSHFFRLQAAGVAVLQNRRYTLDQRLFLLGCLIEDAQAPIVAQKPAALAALCRAYASGDPPPTAAEAHRARAFDGRAYLHYMIGLMNLRSSDPELRREEDRHVGRAYRSLGLTAGEQSLSAAWARHEANRPLYRKAMGHYAAFLENYWVNAFFMGLYPFRVRKTGMMHNYQVFAVSCKALEFLLLGLAAEKGGAFSDEDALRLAQWYFYREHHLNHLQAVHDYVSARQRDTAHFMGTLFDTRAEPLP